MFLSYVALTITLRRHIGRMSDCVILRFFFCHQLLFSEFSKSCFCIPSFEKIIKSSEKRVCTTLNCSFGSCTCGCRESHLICGSVWFMIDRSSDDVKINMTSFSHNKNMKRSFTVSLHTFFFGWIFHKSPTYDRNQINPDHALLLKSCCIQFSARTAAG